MSRVTDREVTTAGTNWDEVNADSSRTSEPTVRAARTLATALVFSATMIARAIENTSKFR